MTLNRDVGGIWFTGLTPWRSWVKWEMAKWTRGQNKTCYWIINRPTNYMMIGIGSDATNESNNSQYTQMEVETYFQNANTVWGLYGNNGTIGSSGNQSNSASISGGSGFFKVKFEGDGSKGGQFTLYRINSGNKIDWDDESQIIKTFAIAGTINPNEVNIMPVFIALNGGTHRILANLVE